MDDKARTERRSRWATSRLYQEGMAAFDAGRYADAIEKLTPLADRRDVPGTLAEFYLGQAHLRQGVAHLRSKRFDDALRHLNEARRLNPQAAGLSRYLAAALAGGKRFDRAAAEFDRQSGAHNADADLPIRLAHAQHRDGRIDEAFLTLESAVAKNPGRGDLHLQLGILHAARDDYESAHDALSAAAERSPDDPDARLHLGLTLGALKRPAEAVEHLAAARRLRPNDAHLAVLLTLASRAAGQAGTETTIDIEFDEPAPPDAAAIDVLGELIAGEPDFVEAFLHLPASDVDEQVFAMLAVTIETALERHPEYADLHHHCSRIYARLNRTDDAIRAARRAVEINPRYVQALIQLGRLYSETDRASEAIERLGQAIESGGNYPDVHFLLGRLHRRSGNSPQACISLVRALRLNRDYDAARTELEEIICA